MNVLELIDHLTGVDVPEEGTRASSGVTSRRPTDLSEGREGTSRPRKVDVEESDGDTW